MTKSTSLILVLMLTFGVVGGSFSVCAEFMASHQEFAAAHACLADCCCQDACEVGQDNQPARTQQRSTVLVLSPVQNLSFSELISAHWPSPITNTISLHHDSYSAASVEVYLLNASFLI
jgi:hypothetical protein